MNRYLSRSVTALLVMVLAAPAWAGGGQLGWWKYIWKPVRESVEVSDLVEFNTPNKVNGSVILIRDFDNRVVDVSLSTSALMPDWAYSIWWAVFNFPQYCIEPYRCSVLDLEVNGGDPRVRVSVFWGGGLIADSYGHASTALKLTPGRTGRELFAGSGDYGLMNFHGAELHLVLRSHGVAGVAGTVAEQIGTATDGCPESGCVNEFASIHPPRE